MNIAAIGKICTQSDDFTIINTDSGEQWLGNGIAMYLVEGIQIGEDCIPALFDLSDKQLKKTMIREINFGNPVYTSEPDPENEELLESMGYVLSGSTLYRALKGKKGMVFIDTKYLRPVQSSGYLEFYARWIGEAPVIAVYNKMFCAALIAAEWGERARNIRKEAEKIVEEQVYAPVDKEPEAKASDSDEQMEINLH